ncbi:MAG: hypothetical protein K0S55_420, partial [Clostridia bacterium]|nr:hypothetical protein [Clostridia bacterium]
MPRPKKEKPNRSDNRFEIKESITINGRTKRKSFYSRESRDDAHRQAEEYKLKLGIAEATGKGVIARNVLFKDWALKWLELYIKGKVKDNTYRGTYENPVKVHLIPYFGETFMPEITPSAIQEFFDIKSEKYSYETIKKMRSCLRSIFDTAVEEGFCLKNPVTKKTKIAADNTISKKRAYTQAQYDVVLEFARAHPNGTDIIILMETGMSRSEVTGLDRDNDIDAVNNVIHVRNGTVDIKDVKTNKYKVLTSGLKNKYRERDVPVKRFVIDLILSKPKEISFGGNKKKKIPPKTVTTKFVVSSPTGQAYSPHNWYRRVYQPFMEDMNTVHPDIPILSPHELRHTRATLWK